MWRHVRYSEHIPCYEVRPGMILIDYWHMLDPMDECVVTVKGTFLLIESYLHKCSMDRGVYIKGSEYNSWHPLWFQETCCRECPHNLHDWIQYLRDKYNRI